jgi:hypothetical protein
MRRCSLALLALSLAVALPGPAQAKPNVTQAKPNVTSGLAQAKPRADAATKRETLLEVSVLHATRDKKPRDPRVGDVPELKEAPFSSYESYELVSRSQLSLLKGARRKLGLPNGRQLEARLEDVLPDASVRLIASINRPGGSDFLPLLEVKARAGQSFIVAGQSYKGGILVLVFKVLR